MRCWHKYIGFGKRSQKYFWQFTQILNISISIVWDKIGNSFGQLFWLEKERLVVSPSVLTSSIQSIEFSQLLTQTCKQRGKLKSRKNRKLNLISFSQVRVRRIDVRQKSVKTTAAANLLFEATFKGGWFQTRGENAVVCRCSLPIFTEFGRIWICTIPTLEVLEILAILLWMRTRWLLDNCLIIASTGQLNSLSPSSSSSSSSSLLVPVTSTHCHHHHQCHIDKHRNHQRRRYNYSLSRLDF